MRHSFIIPFTRRFVHIHVHPSTMTRLRRRSINKGVDPTSTCCLPEHNNTTEHDDGHAQHTAEPFNGNSELWRQPIFVPIPTVEQQPPSIHPPDRRRQKELSVPGWVPSTNNNPRSVIYGTTWNRAAHRKSSATQLLAARRSSFCSSIYIYWNFCCFIFRNKRSPRIVSWLSSLLAIAKPQKQGWVAIFPHRHPNVGVYSGHSNYPPPQIVPHLLLNDWWSVFC